MSGRTENTKRNAIWGMANRVAGLLLPFITRTVIIRALGSEYLGLSSLFTSVLTVLNLAELGMGSSIVYSMYKPLAENDHDLVCALLNLYKRVYRVIGTIILIVGLMALPIIPNLIHGDVPQDINVQVLYAMYLVNTSISYLTYAYSTSLLHAAQRNDLSSKTTICITSVSSLLQIAVLVITHNYYLFFTVQIVSTIATNLTNHYVANRFFPQFVCSGMISNEVKEDVKKRVAGLMMIKVAQVSRNSLDDIIISTFFGLRVVAVYDNYYYVISAVTSLLLVLMNAMSASVGNSVAVDTREKNLESMRIFNYFYMLLSGLFAAFMAVVYQSFMVAWVGIDLLFPYVIEVLFVLYFILQKIGDVQAQYFDAAGLWWEGRYRGIVEAVANLTLNIVLGYWFGSLGVLIATIITIVLINFPLSVYYIFKYYFRCSPKEFVIEQLLNLFSIFISCVPAVAMGHAIMINGYIGNYILLVFASICAVALYIILATLLGFRRPIALNSFSWVMSHLVSR